MLNVVHICSSDQIIRTYKIRKIGILTSSLFVLFLEIFVRSLFPVKRESECPFVSPNCNYNDCSQTGSLNTPISHWLFKQIVISIILMECWQIYFLQNNQVLNRYPCSILLEFIWSNAPNDRHQKLMLIYYMIKRRFQCKILLYENLRLKKCLISEDLQQAFCYNTEVNNPPPVYQIVQCP